MGEFEICPFCASDNWAQGFNWAPAEDGNPLGRPFSTFVECVDCGARGPEKLEWNDAVVAWDGRLVEPVNPEADPSAPTPYEALTKTLDQLRADRPWDSGAYGEPLQRDQYNAETRGYREALTDVETALRKLFLLGESDESDKPRSAWGDRTGGWVDV